MNRMNLRHIFKVTLFSCTGSSIAYPCIQCSGDNFDPQDIWDLGMGWLEVTDTMTHDRLLSPIHDRTQGWPSAVADPIDLIFVTTPQADACVKIYKLWVKIYKLWVKISHNFSAFYKIYIVISKENIHHDFIVKIVVAKGQNWRKLSALWVDFHIFRN